MKIFQLLLLFVLVITSSCTIKEKVVLSEDGSGTFSYGFDVSALMKMGKPTDSTKAPKIMDSIFTFKEVLAPMKDSIAKLSEVEKAQFKLLENFRVKMKINEVKKEFSYDMEFDFPATDSLVNVVSPTKAASLLALSDKKLDKRVFSASKEKEKSNTSFSYDGKYFIKTIVLNKEFKKTKEKKEPKSKAKKKEEAQDDLSKKMDELFKECKYTIEYHFPKKIKAISLKGATIAPDKKSFVFDIPIQNLEENMDLGFKVEFE